jgi:hypothetical protein
VEYTSTPILHSAEELWQEEQAILFARKQSLTAILYNANPTLAYSCSSGEEGENERSISLGRGKSDSFLPLLNEASPIVLDPLGSGDKEGKKRGTSLGKEEISTFRKGTLSSSASKRLAEHSDEERKMKSPPPVFMLNWSGNSSRSSESDPENRVGDGKAQGNSSSEAAAAASRPSDTGQR